MVDFNSTLRLWKYEALGNDYLVVESGPGAEAATAVVVRLCDRHRGVGSDGLLVVDPATRVVRIINPDGSEAEKSGNGLRIAAAHLVLRHRFGYSFTLRTAGGDAPVEIRTTSRAWINAEIGIGRPVVGPEEFLDPPGVRGTPVDVGNPHFVVFDDLGRVDELGPAIETHARFPDRTNVQVAELVDRGTVRAEIWERGAGRTLASGTSAAAVAATAMARGMVGDRVKVLMAGGTLEVRRDAEGALFQTGPARYLFAVSLVPADLRE